MSSGPDVRVIVDTDVAVSNQVDPNFFGGNLLFTNDQLDGTFGDKFEELNLNLLRFPGGGIAAGTASGPDLC